MAIIYMVCFSIFALNLATLIVLICVLGELKEERTTKFKVYIKGKEENESEGEE